MGSAVAPATASSARSRLPVPPRRQPRRLHFSDVLFRLHPRLPHPAVRLALVWIRCRWARAARLCAARLCAALRQSPQTGGCMDGLWVQLSRSRVGHTTREGVVVVEGVPRLSAPPPRAPRLRTPTTNVSPDFGAGGTSGVVEGRLSTACPRHGPRGAGPPHTAVAGTMRSTANSGAGRWRVRRLRLGGGECRTDRR